VSPAKRSMSERIALNRGFGIAILFNQDRYLNILPILRSKMLIDYRHPFFIRDL
jgi:hypothetical protein